MFDRHSVRLTVRSADKAQKLIAAHPEAKDKIDYVIVKDIALPGAFDEAVQSNPPFEAVLQLVSASLVTGRITDRGQSSTASPFHFNVTPETIERDMLQPAIQGTVSILKAIKKYAPTVKRVVVTSSFASILDPTKGTFPGKTYSEADWNPVTWETATADPTTGYRASKTLAERAAWKFVDQEKPNFTLATINPPMVSQAAER